jgi:hypothetical protein
MDKLAKLLAAIIYVPAYMASAFSALMVVSDLLLGEDSFLPPYKVTNQRLPNLSVPWSSSRSSVAVLPPQSVHSLR